MSPGRASAAARSTAAVHRAAALDRRRPGRSAVSIVSAASPIVRTARARCATSGRERREVAVLVAAAEDQEHASVRESLERLGRRVDVGPLGVVDPADAAGLGDELGAVRQARKPRQGVQDRGRGRPEALGRGDRRERVLEVVRARAGRADRRRAPRAASPPTSETSAPVSSHTASSSGPRAGRPRREKRTRRAGVASSRENASSALRTAKSAAVCRANSRALAAA